MKGYGVFLLFLIYFIISSCSGEDDPREIFLATYTAEEFCMNGANFNSNITVSSNSNQVIWSNFLGQDGPADDVTAQVTGNDITVVRQSVDGLEASGSGTLMSNGSIDFDMIVYAGPIAVPCNMIYNPN